ncbi:MAG: GIY-YIG nuclease family protein [Firmicutes bacterium]|nr:GIY-YIG nuclease family protein [Bacillota bacterium]MBQ4093311.1 GIY-YIG nuclease family protein [Bacillota bacterium]
MAGKTVNLFLKDGVLDGSVKATLNNWNGVIYSISRKNIEKGVFAANLENKCGIYFLFGHDDGDLKESVYIGQAQDILKRIGQHIIDPQKKYWMNVVCFTTTDDSFGSTEICYLESRFIVLARECLNYKVQNEASPNIGNISEEKRLSLDEQIDFALMVLRLLGHASFDKAKEECAGDLEMLYQNSKAFARYDDGNFILCKGSQISPKLKKSCPKSILSLRAQYADIIDENFVLIKDIFFSSSSAAASFVAGVSCSGPKCWK